MLALAPVLAALLLFILNNSAVIGGWLHPPQGYSPFWLPRAGDIAQYEATVRGYQNHWLAPNYSAPWAGEPAVLMPVLWVLSKLCFLGLPFPAAYHLVQLFFYIVAAYALLFLLRAVTETRKEFYSSFLVMICAVPVSALALIPLLIAGRHAPRPGLGAFVFDSSDGFLHGISGSLMVTFGTATVLCAFFCLATYIKRGDRKWLGCTSAIILVSAFGHPFEFVVIVGAGTLTLSWLHRNSWRRLVGEVTALVVPAIIGLAPYVLLVSRHDWLREAASQNHWAAPPPQELLLRLGLPAILSLILLFARPRMSSRTDLLLQTWFVLSLVAVYVPFLPHSQHMLDGFVYVSAILLVRQAAQTELLIRAYLHHRRAMHAMLAGALALTLPAYPMFYEQSYSDGQAPHPKRLFSAVQADDERAAISWLRTNARSEDLILASPGMGAWLSTVPMHTFASHYIFSITYEEQYEIATRFYAGDLDADGARAFLQKYGFRYVIAGEAGPTHQFLQTVGRARAQFGTFLLYELPGNTIKSYPRDLRGESYP